MPPRCWWQILVRVKARVVNWKQLDVVAFKIVLVVLECANCSMHAYCNVLCILLLLSLYYVFIYSAAKLPVCFNKLTYILAYGEGALRETVVTVSLSTVPILSLL